MKPSSKSVLTYISHNLEYIIFFILTITLAILLAYRSWEGFFNETKGINQLDAIIYINLENRGDRKDLLLKELAALDTNMSKVNKVSGIYIPKNGHKGCLQSHILALNMIKLNKPRWNRVLILEDDAELTEESDTFNNDKSANDKYVLSISIILFNFFLSGVVTIFNTLNNSSSVNAFRLKNIPFSFLVKGISLLIICFNTLTYFLYPQFLINLNSIALSSFVKVIFINNIICYNINKF